MEQTTKTYKIYTCSKSLLWGIHRAVLKAKCKELIENNKLNEVGTADFVHAEQLNTISTSLIAIHLCYPPPSRTSAIHFCHPPLSRISADILVIEDEKSYKFILCFTQTGSSSDNGISGELIIGTATSLNNGLKAVVIVKDEDSILDVEEFARSAREAVDNLILAIKTQPCTSAASKALDSLYAIQDEYIDSVNRNTEL